MLLWNGFKHKTTMFTSWLGRRIVGMRIVIRSIIRPPI